MEKTSELSYAAELQRQQGELLLLREGKSHIEPPVSATALSPGYGSMEVL
jgi:hypothetical protein